MSAPTGRERVTQLERGYDELRTLLNRAMTERDRLQAENAALVAALVELVDYVGATHTHNSRGASALCGTCADLEAARAALADHAARTEEEGPR